MYSNSIVTCASRPGRNVIENLVAVIVDVLQGKYAADDEHESDGESTGSEEETVITKEGYRAVASGKAKLFSTLIPMRIARKFSRFCY